MKILVVENGRGAYTQYTWDLAESLAARGESVVYLASRVHSLVAPNGVDLRPVLLPNAPIHSRPGHLGFVLRKFGYSLRNLGLLWRYANRLEVDLIHLQLAVPLTFAYLLPLLRRRQPIVLTVHDVLPHHGFSLFNRRRHLQRLYHAVDHLIVHTTANRETLQREFGVPGDHVTIIPHGTRVVAPPAEQCDGRRRLGLPKDAFLVAFVGVVRANKRLDLLVRAFAMALSRNPRLRLMIAGKPSSVSADAIRRMLAEAGVTDQAITRLSWLSEDKMGLYLDACDTCVLPYTDFYAQSGVLMKAIAHGVPLIVSDIGSLAETVRQGDAGLVFPPGDVTALAERILQVAESQSLRQRLSDNARRIARERYSWSMASAMTVDFYARLLANGPGAERTLANQTSRRTINSARVASRSNAVPSSDTA